MARRLEPDDFEFAVPTTATPSDQQVALAAALIERMQRFCKERAIRLIVVDIPTTAGPYRYGSSLPPALLEKLRAANVEYITSSVAAPGLRRRSGDPPSTRLPAHLRIHPRVDRNRNRPQDSCIPHERLERMTCRESLAEPTPADRDPRRIYLTQTAKNRQTRPMGSGKGVRQSFCLFGRSIAITQTAFRPSQTTLTSLSV